MKLEPLIESIAKVENAGGEFYLTLPYTSEIGNASERLELKVPIKHEIPSASDKKALLEAATIQGGLGRWMQKDDGSLVLTTSSAR